MNIKVRLRLLLGTLTTLATLSTTTSAPVWAAADTPVSVELSLVGSDTVTQGEPIVLHYTITNAGDEGAVASMGADLEGWVVRQLVSTTGTSVSPRANALPAPRGGVRADGQLLTPHSSAEGYLVASRWFAVPAPGQYVLKLHPQLTYSKSMSGNGVVLSGSVEQLPTITRSAIHVDTREQTLGTASASDYSFPLTILPADPARLQATAQRLYQGIIAKPSPTEHAIDGQRRVMMVKALFSIPEAQTVGVWRRLVGDPALSPPLRGYAARELARVHSPAAADILAGMVSAAHDPDQLSAASSNLLQMYTTGDAALRQHIKGIYGSWGLDLPEQITNAIHD